jgi:PAS domain S-box-containing protein
MKLSTKKIALIFILLSVGSLILIGDLKNGASLKDENINHIDDGKNKSNVLLINSYHKGLSWTDDITSAITEKLKAGSCCELYIEYMDAKRYPVKNFEKEFYSLLKKRYKDLKIQAVIVSDNNALVFAKRYRKDLFPDVPVIFCGINNFSDNLIDNSGWFTGVVETTDAAANFEIMKKLNPRMRNCIIIGDNTPTGEAEVAAARKALGILKDGISIIYWINLSTDVLLRSLKGLNNREDTVLLTVFNRDAEGRYFNYEEIGRLITSNTDAQVYGLWQFYIGEGVVGGNMANARDQGLAAAGMAQRVLIGEHISSIPIQRESPNRIIFDYAALERFNIRKEQLPEGAIIENIPHSIIRDNIGIISSAVFLIIGEGAALLLLFRIFLRSRGKAMKDLEVSEEKYRVLVDKSFDIIYRLNSDGIITFASPSWTVILGHQVSDVLGRPYADFIHPDYMEAAELFLKNLLSPEDHPSVIDYKIRHVDGSWRMHTSSIVPVTDKSGAPIAFVGIAKDITDRKNSEYQVKKLLQEKELLLKEVHHRIKNNMLTISGLLYLQADSVKNDIAASALNDARNRVQSMMVIYDKLYRSADFRHISAKDYLSNLIIGVSSAFAGSSHVEVEMNIEDSILDSEILFPVGIIINELMSNVYKYAFTGRKEGAVKISFLRKSEKLIELSFEDNGIGMPEDVISGKSAGFGMNLIRILVKQIDGDLHISNNNGTLFKITFLV